MVASVTMLAASCGIVRSRAPSPTDCIRRWNDPGNSEASAAVAQRGFTRAYVARWPTKAGDHCSATFFNRSGREWVMFVLWLDSPEPRVQFARDIGGSRYGRGELGAEKPMPPNAEVDQDGTLRQEYLRL
jgi:hypothetical protein